MAVNPLAIEFSATPVTSNPQSIVEVNGSVYFQASNRSTGAELWKSDGTAAGTQLVRDLAPGLYTGSYPSNLTNFNGMLYFTASDPFTGQQNLWKSDGTSAGTVLVTDSTSANINGPTFFSQLTVVGSTLFFVAQRNGTIPPEPSSGNPTARLLVRCW